MSRHSEPALAYMLVGHDVPYRKWSPRHGQSRELHLAVYYPSPGEHNPTAFEWAAERMRARVIANYGGTWEIRWSSAEVEEELLRGRLAAQAAEAAARRLETGSTPGTPPPEIVDPQPTSQTNVTTSEAISGVVDEELPF